MNTNSLRSMVNKYLEWIRNDGCRLVHVMADIRERHELETNEKKAVRYWVKKCLAEKRYM